MTTVHITPLPAWARKTKYRPGPPPIFDGPPTPADIELARALFLALDSESQSWYSVCRTFAGLFTQDAAALPDRNQGSG